MKTLCTISILLLFQSCKPKIVTPNFHYIEMFSFNGWNQNKAFRVDSLGKVHIHTIDLSESNDYCFSLNNRQLDTVRSFVDSSLRVERDDNITMIQCDDCPISKAIIMRENKKFELNSDKGKLPESYFNLISYLMKVEHHANKNKCVDTFNLVELSRGYDDLFRVPSFKSD